MQLVYKSNISGGIKYLIQRRQRRWRNSDILKWNFVIKNFQAFKNLSNSFHISWKNRKKKKEARYLRNPMF